MKSSTFVNSFFSATSYIFCRRMNLITSSSRPMLYSPRSCRTVLFLSRINKLHLRTLGGSLYLICQIADFDMVFLAYYLLGSLLKSLRIRCKLRLLPKSQVVNCKSSPPAKRNKSKSPPTSPKKSNMP